MGYVAGEKILDDEYNNFLSGSSAGAYGINHIQGTGDGEYGLGQTAIAGTSAGATIQASQWNSLFTAMTNVANHTNRSITSNSAVLAGDTVSAISALQTDLNNLAADVAGGSASATALTTNSKRNDDASGRWATSHVVEQSVTFTNGDHARYYFNAGGKIRIVVSRTGNGGSSATAKDGSLDEVITAAGNIDIKSGTTTRSGSGETVTAGTLGYYDLTTSYQTFLQVAQDSGTYSGNILIKVEAKSNGAQGSNNDHGSVITIKTSILDNDSGDSEYTSGNTSGVDQYENFIGVTRVNLTGLEPNTTQGLSTAYTIASTAGVSNTTT
jgi:hypothetical protein